MEHTAGCTAFSGGRKINSCILPGGWQRRPLTFSQVERMLTLHKDTCTIGNPRPHVPDVSHEVRVQEGGVPEDAFYPLYVMLWFLLYTAYIDHGHVLAESHNRNLTYIAEVRKGDQYENLTVWNEIIENREKIQGKCRKFHDDRFSELFFYWPEDNPLFRHCCANFTTMASRYPYNFTYSEYGQQLEYGIYRDVGYFDQCMPFWKCRKTYLEIYDNTIYVSYCEMSDLTKLYWNRFWRLTVWEYSLLDTIFPWFLILEGLVILLGLAVFPLTWRLARENPTKTSRWEYLVPTTTIWLKSIWKRLLMDWSHLCLLAMVGNGLMETLRRQSVYTLQSKMFFSYTSLYILLFVLLSAASGLQQLAYWIGSATEPKVLRYWAWKKPDEKAAADVENNIMPRPSGAASDATGNAHVKNTQVSFLTDNDEQPGLHDGDKEISTLKDVDAPKLLRSFKKCASKTLGFKNAKRSYRKYLSVKVFKLGDDYKWHPIAAQVAILFALTTFLTCAITNDDEASNLFGILLGYVVQAGSLWTGIYAVLVFFQRGGYILKFFWKLSRDNRHG